MISLPLQPDNLFNGLVLFSLLFGGLCFLFYNLFSDNTRLLFYVIGFSLIFLSVTLGVILIAPGNEKYDNEMKNFIKIADCSDLQSIAEKRPTYYTDVKDEFLFRCIVKGVIP